MPLFMNREFQKEICVRSRLRNKYWVEPSTEIKVAYKNWVEPSTENKVAYQKLGWTINGKQSSVPNTLLNHQRKTKQRTKNREISASKSEGKVLRNIWVKFQQKVSKLTKVFGILLNLSCQIREWLPNKGMIASNDATLNEGENVVRDEYELSQTFIKQYINIVKSSCDKNLIK